jgi:hypothetical protein
MSKSFYFGSFIVGPVLLAVFYFVGMTFAIGFFEVLVLVALYLFFVFLGFVYKMWKAIRDEQAKTTPSKAVVYSLVPIVNAIWIPMIFLWYPENFNDFVKRNSLSSPPLRYGPFLAFSISFLINVVLTVLDRVSPHAIYLYLGLVVAVVFYVSFFVIVWIVCDAVNALPDEGPKPKGA